MRVASLLLLVVAAGAARAADVDASSVHSLRSRMQARSANERDLKPAVCHPVQGMTLAECTALEKRMVSTTDACSAQKIVSVVQGYIGADWQGPFVVWTGQGCLNPCANKAIALGIKPTTYCAQQKSPVYHGDGVSRL